MSRDEDAAAVYRELVLFARRARATSGQLSGLSLVAYTLLSHIATMPGTRAIDLADHYNLDKSTVSRQLTELERLGLITRSGGGRAGQSIELTTAGAAAYRTASDAMQAAVATRLSACTDADIAGFAALLQRFNLP